MKAIAGLFLDHPRAVGETYGEHFGVAMSVAGRLVVAGAACGVHAVAPSLFPTTASRTILSLHERIQRRGPIARGRPTADEPLGADCYCI